MTDAVNVFLQQSLNAQGLPSLVTPENETYLKTQAAAHLMGEIEKSWASVTPEEDWISQSELYRCLGVDPGRCATRRRHGGTCRSWGAASAICYPTHVRITPAKADIGRLRAAQTPSQLGMPLQEKLSIETVLQVLKKHLDFHRVENDVISIARIINGRQDYLHTLFGE